jgi:hypothetical protein
LNIQDDVELNQKKIKKYFGELEIRGLIIISYYSLIYSDSVDSRIARRCSKMIILLSRRIVVKCKTNKNYIHLLSILLQLLSTGIKIHHKNYENVKVLEDIIKLLLCTYNFYNSSIQSDHSYIKLNEFNFQLIKATNPELYLKRTAA